MNTITALSILESEKSLEIVNSFSVNGVVFADLHSLHSLAYASINNFTFEHGISLNFYNTDVKHLYYHMFIHQLCDFIAKNTQKVVFYDSVDIIPYDKQYEKVKKYITSKIKKLLPLVILESQHNFKYIKENYSNKWSVMCEIDKGLARVNTFDKSKFTLAKLKRFLDKQNLIFLQEAYFNLPQIKLPLLT